MTVYFSMPISISAAGWNYPTFYYLLGFMFFWNIHGEIILQKEQNYLFFMEQTREFLHLLYLCYFVIVNLKNRKSITCTVCREWYSITTFVYPTLDFRFFSCMCTNILGHAKCTIKTCVQTTTIFCRFLIQRKKTP